MNPFALMLSTLVAATSMAGLVPRAAPPAQQATAPNSRSVATARGVWPISPPHLVVRRFEPPSTPWGAGHRGVDLLGTVGEPVRSALAGTVSFAGVLAGRGVVVVDHGRFRTTYEPVIATVSLGDAVGRGDVIGHLALPRSHCLPRACLHWGLIEAETYLDPLMLVGGGPIRLLPMEH